MSLTCSYETVCIGGDRDRLAHNPEAAGDNYLETCTNVDRARRVVAVEDRHPYSWFTCGPRNDANAVSTSRWSRSLHWAQRCPDFEPRVPLAPLRRTTEPDRLAL